MLRFNSNFKYVVNKKVSAKLCRYFLCLFIVFSGFISLWEPAFAANTIDNDFTTENYVVNVNINPDYTYSVEEDITVNFLVSKRGIFRYIPFEKSRYDVTPISIEDKNIENKVEYATGFPHRGFQIGKIGSDDIYLTGLQNYNLRYSILGKIGTKHKGDVITVNLMPTNWPNNVKKFKIRLNSFTELDWNKATVYVGTQESKTTIKDFYNVKLNRLGSKTVEISGTNLPANTGITFQVPFDSSLWVQPYNHNNFAHLLFAIFGIITAISFIVILKSGREKIPAPSVEFYPPNNLCPADIGYIIDNTIDGGDLTSMLIYFANKGYVQIYPIMDEASPDKDPKHFQFKKIREIDSNEPSHAIAFFNSLFDGYDTFETNEESTALIDAIQMSTPFLEAAYRKKLVTAGKKSLSYLMNLFVSIGLGFSLFFTATAGNIQLWWLSIASGILFFAGQLLFKRARMKKEILSKAQYGSLKLFSFAFIIAINAVGFMFFKEAYSYYIPLTLSLVLATFSCTFAQTAVLITKDTEILRLKARIIGFRNFIETCEKDRLEMLLNKNPEYFYHILPYAYVLGLSDRWIGNFEKYGIKPQAPTWYNGNFAFNYMLFRSITSSASSAYSEALTNHLKENISSVGSGGFGSGGFSGGGFGGGGGGSW